MHTRFLQQDYEDNNRQSLLEKILFPVKTLNEKKLAAALNRKAVLISGASYGIGAAFARLCSNYPVTLILVARTAERLKAIESECKEKPCRVICYTADIRDESHINLLLQFLQTEKINIDIFVNNAGKSIYRLLVNSTNACYDTWRCAATNYTGPVKLLVGLLPGILHQRGQIVNVSAVNVLLPPAAGWSAYQSSKAAFDQWLLCAEPELQAKGVSVSSIYLPLVRTKMSMVNINKHQQPAMSKEKAARLIARYICHQKRKYIPWWLGAVRAANSFFPNLFYKIQLRRLKRH